MTLLFYEQFCEHRFKGNTLLDILRLEPMSYAKGVYN